MKKNLISILILFMSFLSSWAVEYPATDKNIDYIGRVYKTDDGSVKFDWVGVYLRFRFTGNCLSMNASDSKSNYYRLFVDGKYLKDINIKGTEKEIKLAENLEQGVHTLMLYKRTEANQGTTTIRSFVLEDGGKLLSWMNKSTRKLEFIGNSITCGYGTDTNNRNEGFTPETENAYFSYASLTARYFQADYTLVAHSGQGVVRNYGDKKSTSDYTMRQRFFCQFDENPEMKWDFSQWRPDAVVINLGTNDFSTQPYPSNEAFVNGYKDLLASVRKSYGNVPVFCLSSPMSNELQRECITKALADLKDPKLFYVPIYNYVLNPNGDYGASSHPSRSGQEKMSMLLIPYISSVMDWPLRQEGKPKR